MELKNFFIEWHWTIYKSLFHDSLLTCLCSYIELSACYFFLFFFSTESMFESMFACINIAIQNCHIKYAASNNLFILA